MVSSDGQPRSRRTANACVACRQSKIKCSGDEPCQNCSRRSVECHFNVGGNKIIVSERYLRDLQWRAGEQDRSSSPPDDNGQGSPTRPRNHRRQRSSLTSPVPFGTPIQYSSASHTFSEGTASATPEASRDTRAFQVSGPTTAQEGDRPGQAHTKLLSPAPTLSGPTGYDSGSGPGTAEYNRNNSPISIWSNTFNVPSNVIENTHKNKRAWLWLAPWSTWSFTVRLMLLLGEKLRPDNMALPASLTTDTNIYMMNPITITRHEAPDVSGLPSLSHAIYLFNTVRFHMGQTYRCLNRVELEAQIVDFYSNAAQRANDNRLWFVKFLLILAFGTAFQAPRTTSKEPPGGKFFARAMAMLPEPRFLWKDSLLAIEVLTMTGVYLFSLDDRESAHLYLSQAIRIAELEGLHTQLPSDKLGSDLTSYCRDLWWTLYIMDRYFSTAVGLPMSVQDSDITTPVSLPGQESHADSARSLQINLSHLLSVILTTVYKTNVMSLEAFMEQTKSVLHTLAHHAQEIERIIFLTFQSSAGTMPPGMRFVTLLYHQCVILATRPLLLSVLKERLDLLGHPGAENWESFLDQTGPIISTGINSAAKTLQILTSDYSLLEAFLPYDVQFAFGASLHLTMASAIFPGVIDYEECRQSAHHILGDLEYRGNLVAGARKTELAHLEDLCQLLVTQVQSRGHQTLHLSSLEDTSAEATTNRAHDRYHEQITQVLQPEALAMGNGDLPNSLDEAQMASNMEFIENIGISSEDFISLVHQIGDPETLPDSMLTLD